MWGHLWGLCGQCDGGDRFATLFYYNGRGRGWDAQCALMDKKSVRFVCIV